MANTDGLSDPDDFGVPLELTEDLLAERVGDLSVDPGVLDVLVAQVVGYVLDAAAGVEEMDRDGVPQRVHRTALDAGGLRVAVEEVLDLPLLEGALAASEEIRPRVVSHAQVSAQLLCGVPPERLFAAETVFQAPQPDPVVLQVHILERQQGRLVHAEPVVVDQREKGPVARGRDRGEEALELVLGEVLGKCDKHAAALLFYDAHDDVLVALEGGGEALDIANLADVVHDEENVPVFSLIGEDVIIDLGDDLLLASWFLTELHVNREVDLWEREVRHVGL